MLLRFQSNDFGQLYRLSKQVGVCPGRKLIDSFSLAIAYSMSMILHKKCWIINERPGIIIYLNMFVT